MASRSAHFIPLPSGPQARERLLGGLPSPLPETSVTLGACAHLDQAIESGVLARRSIGAPVMHRVPVTAPGSDTALVTDLETPVAAPRFATPATRPIGPLRWARNVFIGSALTFMEAIPATLEPIAFLWNNLSTLSRAGIYLLLPALVTALMWNVVPGLTDVYHPATLAGGVYGVALYVSSAFVLMAGGLIGRVMWRGTLKAMKAFAERGEQAFPRAG